MLASSVTKTKPGRATIPTMKRAFLWIMVAALLASAPAGAAGGPGRTPGPQGHGVTLLPNGWRIAPAGTHVGVGDLPLALLEAPDGALVVSSNGWSKPTLTVVDPTRFVVRSKLVVDHAWLGLAWGPDGRRFYVSGGGDNSVREYERVPAGIRLLRTFLLPRPSPESVVGGIAVAPDGKRLYAVHALGTLVSAVDLRSGRVLATHDLPTEGYTGVLTADGATLYVSLWGGARVLELDATTLAVRGSIAVGEHPSAMTLSRDGRVLFVACAHTNAVWVVDLERRTVVERIGIALTPDAPPGSTPNALGLSPDGDTLLVADADNNDVAVVDVHAPGHGQVAGFIPTGWYPTAAQFSRDGKRIYVLDGKGLASLANPRGPQPGVDSTEGQYSGSMLQGALSVIQRPDARALAAYTRTVHELTAGDAVPPVPADSPIPRRRGQPSPIKHVFYVIRENRTYDQILGDLEKGNGDPTLCLFGEDTTPNAHALAREFVLLDNFYVNAEVSYAGHAYSMGAYASDFVEKVWPMNYGHRGGAYLSEGGGPQRNPYGNVTAPPNGYIWDVAHRAGVSVRSYGEFGTRGEEDEYEPREGKTAATVPGLDGDVAPGYAPFDLRVPDNERVDAWLEEFAAYEKAGTLPQLSIIRLGNDHTAGTKPGYPTPRAMIAENDLALGRVVDAISHSRYWKDAAIFVLEDDSQNGPDHVDAHRSVALVVSPFARRGAVDGTLYTTTGVLRTIELLLGLPPMSQYDAAATPLYGAFTGVSAATPYVKRDARVKLDEMNSESAWGAAASMAMDFSQPDRAPDGPLNEIVWRSVRGDAPMPPPARAAFVRAISVADDDDRERGEKPASRR